MAYEVNRDDWDIEESIKYFKRTVEIDEALGVSGRVYHETHRSRSLYAPWVAKCILDVVPQYEVYTNVWFELKELTYRSTL